MSRLLSSLCNAYQPSTIDSPSCQGQLYLKAPRLRPKQYYDSKENTKKPTALPGEPFQKLTSKNRRSERSGGRRKAEERFRGRATGALPNTAEVMRTAGRSDRRAFLSTSRRDDATTARVNPFSQGLETRQEEGKGSLRCRMLTDGCSSWERLALFHGIGTENATHTNSQVSVFHWSWKQSQLCKVGD